MLKILKILKKNFFVDFFKQCILDLNGFYNLHYAHMKKDIISLSNKVSSIVAYVYNT